MYKNDRKQIKDKLNRKAASIKYGESVRTHRQM